MAKPKHIAEFGDFQTPAELAQQATAVVARHIQPAAILEPTCGVGSFLLAAARSFPAAMQAIGFEINPGYVAAAQGAILHLGLADRCRVEQADFFDVDWPGRLGELPDPLLVIGNPPWVTNAALTSMGSDNLPVKTNFHNHHGLAALTGKSNFDISEWMIVRLLEWLHGRRATVAMLCKTMVARKALAHAWKHSLGVQSAELYRIDAAAEFSAAVDAGLLICNLAPGAPCRECRVFSDLASWAPQSTLGFRDGQVVADAVAYDRLRRLRGKSAWTWRSGIKHDCARVMEFRALAGSLKNGLGEEVELEAEHLYPMLKSSDVVHQRAPGNGRLMLLPQRKIGQETAALRSTAPKTWAYLSGRQAELDRRASSIYRNRPAFSIFGVGDYTFAPWKVAISGFYKRLEFTVVGPVDGKPVVFDDTVYFLPCGDEAQARALADVLASPLAKEFFSALVFWDAKRPITADVLSQLDIAALAEELGAAEAIRGDAVEARTSTLSPGARQLRLSLG